MSEVQPDTRERVRSRLIVALDVSTAVEARRLASMLRGLVGMFKIGSQLFSATGPELVKEIVAGGDRVFLDLKFHDIPNTVAAAGVEAMRLGVSIFNIHATGGLEMMARTREVVAEASSRDGRARPAMIAVTVLTSANESTMQEIGVATSVEEQVVRLAQLTDFAGLDGVVASPREIGLLRGAIPNEKFLLVTPGVRPIGTTADDQQRTMSPGEAISAGADYLVVGRPILKAVDPRAAAQSILEDMANGLADK